MANMNKQNTAWPQTGYNKIIENDPQIVKVPMDNVDFGARKGTMRKAANPESGGNGRMGIKHIPNEGGRK